MNRPKRRDDVISAVCRRRSSAKSGYACAWCGRLICDHADVVFAGVVTLDHGDGVIRDGAATS